MGGVVSGDWSEIGVCVCVCVSVFITLCECVCTSTVVLIIQKSAAFLILDGAALR